MKAQEAFERAMLLKQEKIEAERKDIMQRIEENVESLSISVGYILPENIKYLKDEGYKVDRSSKDGLDYYVSWDMRKREDGVYVAYLDK